MKNEPTDFFLQAARFAAEQKVPSFKQEDIPKLRGRMAVELCYKSLLPIKPINSNCITETNPEVKELKRYVPYSSLSSTYKYALSSALM